MALLKVVVVDAASNGAPGFLDVMPFRQVDFLILEGPESSLDHNIVSPTALAVHALVYMVLLEELFVFLAGELTAPIRVQDFWPGHAERLFAGLYAGSGVQRVSSNSHPTVQRLCQSMIAVRYRNPCFIRM